MIGLMQGGVLFVLTTVCFVVEVWALIDCLSRPQHAFLSAGKRTKKFWLLLTGLSTAVGFLGLPYPLGNGYLGLTALFVAVPAFVYMADVRPAVRHYRGGSNRNNRNNKSGW